MAKDKKSKKRERAASWNLVEAVQGIEEDIRELHGRLTLLEGPGEQAPVRGVSVPDHQELLRRKADILMPSAEGSTGLPQDLLSIDGLKKLFSGNGTWHDARGDEHHGPSGWSDAPEKAYGGTD